jgi:signal transduction histidine kinase
MVLAITATIGAAGLVLFLQHRAITTLQSQNQVIVRHISEQTAVDIAVELRRTLDGPVFDTLTAVNHPDLRAGRLDLVAQHYQKGLEAYPHVERFFAWSTTTQASAPGEVMFYGRDHRFGRDPALGRAIFDLARRHAPTQHIYVAADDVGPDQHHQVFLRLFWTDAQRLEYFAVLGFVVEPSTMREHLFDGLRRARLDALLTRRAGDIPLRMRVTDEHGALVYGSADSGTVTGRVDFPMLFYPADDIRSRMATGVAPRPWAIEVGAPGPAGALAGISQGYWPTLLSVALMLVALGLTVQAHRRSTELTQMQTDFVAHVSHQLKTPLSLLSAATETLQMDRIRSPEKLAEYLDTIRAEATRLSTLVQRVLEFSRVQQQRSFEFEQVDLGALTRETVDAFAHGLTGWRFTFEVDPEGSQPHVLADPAALEQVIANLLDNAVKYSGPVKEITVRLRAERARAIVEVTDRGVGMSAADQARIFERFYRAPSAAHRPGFGLGLPIVRELMHAHGGRVDVTSAPGAGSTFRVSLPRVNPSPVTSRARPAGAPEAAS